ncbi:MAG: fused DSP-PTPase phosphatase/NAD kinase-like protein, partial [Pseudomonadota bacterium]
LDIEHINIESRQVPHRDSLERFFKVMDEPTSYPVLIHCYHGVGRTELYTALYRIEYEGTPNSEARDGTRLVVQNALYESSFADGKPKGDFLMNYKPRSMGEQSTFSEMQR